MQAHIYYKELQQFRKPWIWILLSFCLFVVSYKGQPGGIIIVLFVAVLLWILRLETTINSEGILF